MSARHTPGPWMWTGNMLHPVERDPKLSDVHSILDADGGYGFLASKPTATLAELNADRALIAAAPDLLEACVAYLADRAEAGCTADSAAVKAMRAAIQRATREA